MCTFTHLLCTDTLCPVLVTSTFLMLAPSAAMDGCLGATTTQSRRQLMAPLQGQITNSQHSRVCDTPRMPAAAPWQLGEGSAEAWAIRPFVMMETLHQAGSLSCPPSRIGVGPDSSKWLALKLGLRAQNCDTCMPVPARPRRWREGAGEGQARHGAPWGLPLLRPACLGRVPRKPLAFFPI